ncbi:MAG TPA: tetratricopeptide repeat protein [Chloroflexia bacterium]|nr:tetratricopeptide repeat protein [Chloroflexia bacterium]
MDVPTIITIVIGILSLAITVVLGYAPAKLALRDLRRSQQNTKPTTETPSPDTLEVSPPTGYIKHPNNIPAQLTSLIGRDKELDEIKQLIMRSDVRLVTLLGPGGIGKTRLSLQVAEELLDHFKDGVWIVNLETITDTRLLVPTIAQTLGLKETSGVAILDILRSFVRDKKLLLLLDNFEHVIDAASQVGILLTSAPGMKVLVTSRADLQQRGEYQYSVPPLAIPDRSQLLRLEQIARFEAVRLFLARTRQVKGSSFQLTNDNAPTIVEICHKLDGIPLAIELTAPFMDVLTPQTILSMLESRLDLLTGGDKDLPLRQQTLRSAIAWSYDLLTAEERMLFYRMAVFQGGRTLEALKAVCNYDGRIITNILHGVSGLVHKHQLQQREGSVGEPRFWMLETIHEYASEKLSESGEEEALRKEHACYIMRLAEEAEPHLKGKNQLNWLSRLEDERDNIRAALRWVRATSASEDAEDRIEVGLRLAGSIWQFWYMHGYFSEGVEEITRLLEQQVQGEALKLKVEDKPQGQGDRKHSILKASRAKVLIGAGVLARECGDYLHARTYLEEALAIGRELVDKKSIAFSLNNLGYVVEMMGDYSAARSLHEESLMLRKELGDEWGTAESLMNLAGTLRKLGDYIGGRALHEESLALRRKLGDKFGIASSLNNLGNSAFLLGEYSVAHARYSESFALQTELGNRRGIAICLNNLGNVAYIMADYGRAYLHYKEALIVGREIGYRYGIVYALTGLGVSLVGRGEIEGGTRLLGAAEAALGAKEAMLDPEDKMVYEAGIASARSQLGEEAFEQARQEGRAMNIEQATDYALGISD